MPSPTIEYPMRGRYAWDDEPVWDGITTLLDSYAGIRSNDAAMIGYTSDSREAAARVSVALAARGVDTRRVRMAPLHDEGIADRLRAVLPEPTELSGRIVVLTFERDTISHESIFEQALSAYQRHKCIVIRVISTCPELFADALRMAPRDLAARNAALLERLMAAKKLRITAPGGTDLLVTLDNDRYQWVNNHGMLRPGRPLFLPPGEVATFPASIDGVLVADFAYNINVVTDRDVRLHQRPVTVEVKDGRAVQHECADPVVSSFVAESLDRMPYARVVGELGFGTNPGVDSAVPLNSHINERRPGVHLGFGEHNQHGNVVDYSCLIHLDLIARGGLVWVDDDLVPIDLEHVASSPGCGARISNDQLGTDCCGTSDRWSDRAGTPLLRMDENGIGDLAHDIVEIV